MYCRSSFAMIVRPNEYLIVFCDYIEQIRKREHAKLAEIERRRSTASSKGYMDLYVNFLFAKTNIFVCFLFTLKRSMLSIINFETISV